MSGPALRVSEVNGWKPEYLGLDTTSLGKLVTKLDGLMQSMLIEQDDLAESWNGAGADAAARRVVNEKTAGSHISGKIDDIKTVLTSGQSELQDAKNFVLTKRKGFVDSGFEVDDRGIVSANEKVKQIQRAGGDRGEVMAVGFAVMAEAGRYTLEMLEALQHARSVANGVLTKLATAKSELLNLVMLEAPSKVFRTTGLVPGVALDGAGLDPSTNPLVAVTQLGQGIPVTGTSPDGSTTTITPNPDGTVTIAQSMQGPDGSAITTTTTGDGPPTTTVSKPRLDGSGIIDTTITGLTDDSSASHRFSRTADRSPPMR